MSWHNIPSATSFLDRDYAPWVEPHIIIDTAHLSAAEVIAMIERAMDAKADAEQHFVLLEGRP
jgi:hypothetical protein